MRSGVMRHSWAMASSFGGLLALLYHLVCSKTIWEVENITNLRSMSKDPPAIAYPAYACESCWVPLPASEVFMRGVEEAECAVLVLEYLSSSFLLLLRVALTFALVSFIGCPWQASFIIPECHHRTKPCIETHAVGKLLMIAAVTCHFLAFQVHAHAFTTKEISQSSSLPGDTNTITVTLVADTNLTTGCTITVSGLTGALATSPVTLLDAGDNSETIFSDGTRHGRGAWSAGNLTLTILNGTGMVANKSYSFGFRISNPSLASVSPDVTVEVQGPVTIPASLMTKLGRSLYGVTKGTDPLTVVVPAWRSKSIAQATPVPGIDNLISVTLQATYDLEQNSTVTISGLAGTQTRSTSSLPVSSSGKFASTGDWNISGFLKLTVAAGQTAACGENVLVTFTLTNTNSVHVSPAVSVEADMVASGRLLGRIVRAAMDKPGGSKYGVAKGQDPLTVVVPTWSRKSIQQSRCYAGQPNTLTATLQANYVLATGSTVSILGLTGSQTIDTLNLSVASAPNVVSASGNWSRRLGRLVLTCVADIPAGTPFRVTWVLYNSEAPQPAPLVQVSALIADANGAHVASISPENTTKNGSTLYGVASGYDVLTIVPYSLVSSVPWNLGHRAPSAVTLTGIECGVYATAKARLSYTGCEATLWFSDTRAVCKSASRHLPTRTAILTVGDSVVPGSLSEAMSYDVLALAATARGNVARFSTLVSFLMGRPVEIVGSNRSLMNGSVVLSHNTSRSNETNSSSSGNSSTILTLVGGRGMADYSGRQRHGRTSCELSGWLSETSVLCRVAMSAGASNLVSLTVGTVVSSITQAWSLDAAGVGRMQRTNHAAAEWLTVVYNGGCICRGHSLQGRIGRTASDATEWLSETSARCRAGSAFGRSLHVMLTGGPLLLATTLTESCSFDVWSFGVDKGGLAFAHVAGLAVSGPAAHGAAGGYSHKLRLGPSACQQTWWQSDSAVICSRVRGWQSSRQVIITGGNMVGSITEAWSNEAVVSRVRTGHNMSALSAGNRALMHSGAIVVLVNTSGHRVLNNSNLSEISNYTESGASFDQWIQVSCNGLGISTHTVRSGKSGCEATWWQSDTSLKCKGAFSSRATQKLTVTSGLRSGSLSEAMSLDANHIAVVREGSTQNEATALPSKMTVEGHRAWPRSFDTARARTGITSCRSTAWITLTALLCRFHHAHSTGTMRVVATVGSCVSSVSETVTVDAPLLRGSALPRTTQLREASTAPTSTTAVAFTTPSPVAGMWNMTCANITDSNVSFCDTSSSNTAYFTATPAPFSTSQGIATTPAPVGSGMHAQVEVHHNFAATGATWLTVHGFNLGRLDTSMHARVGSTAGEASWWHSDSAVACFVPRIHLRAKTQAFMVTIGHRGGTITQLWSPDAISVTRVVGAANAGSGTGQSLSISGSGSASYSASAQARLHSTDSEATVWISDTSSVCKVAAASLSTRKAVMTAGDAGGASSLSAALSHDACSLSSSRWNYIIHESRIITINASASLKINSTIPRILMHGSRGARSDQTGRARVGGSGCEHTIWISDTSVTCRACRVLELGGTLRVIATAGIIVHAGTLTDLSSFDVLSFRSRALNVAKGSVVVWARYDEIGKQQIVAHSAASRVGASACASTRWLNATSIVALPMVSARGHSRGLVVTAGVLLSSISIAISFDVMAISSVTSHNTSVDTCSRGFRMSVSLELQTMDTSAAVRLGGSACEATMWAATSALKCLVPSGRVEVAVQVAATLALSVSTLSQAFTYLGPFATGANPQNVLRSWRQLLGMNVGGFERSPTSLLGLTSAEETQWRSDTAVIAKVGGWYSGFAASQRIGLSILGFAASCSLALSYDAASMVIGGVNTTNVHLRCTPQAVLIQGPAMRGVGASVSVRFGATVSEATAWLSVTSLLGRVSRGSGSLLRVVMTSGGQVSTISQALSYDTVEPVAAFAPSSSGFNLVPCGTCGNQVKVLHATFHAFDFGTVRLRVGGSACCASSWLSDTAVVCHLSRPSGSVTGASAAHLALVMSIASHDGCITSLLSYDRILLSNVFDANAPVAAQKHVTLVGVNFGPGHISSRARVHSTGTLAHGWTSDTSLGCKFPMSSGALQASLVVSIGVDTRGSLSEAVSFDAPVLFPSVFNVPQSGMVGISLAGINFGAHDRSVVARVGGSLCMQTIWQSDTLILCKVPRAGRVESVGKDVVLLLPLHELLISKALSFDPMRNMVPSQGLVFVRVQMALMLSATVEPQRMLDAVTLALVDTLASSGMSVTSDRVFVEAGTSTVSARRESSLTHQHLRIGEGDLGGGHDSTRVRALRRAETIPIDARVLEEKAAATQLVTSLSASFRDGTFFSALAAADLPVAELTLTDDIGLIDDTGNLQKCCCDPALCSCYVCLEQIKPAVKFSIVTAVVAILTLGIAEFDALCAVYSKTFATGCFIQYNRSKRHGDARNGTLAKVSPEDRQALANLQVRTEARLNARLAWQ